MLRYSLTTEKPVRPSRLHFAVLSAAEIERMSVCEVTDTTLYYRGLPCSGGLLDPLMGTVDRRHLCATCMRDAQTCQGHSGHMRLAFPVYHVGFVDTVLKTLRTQCFACARVCVDASDDIFEKQEVDVEDEKNEEGKEGKKKEGGKEGGKNRNIKKDAKKDAKMDKVEDDEEEDMEIDDDEHIGTNLVLAQEETCSITCAATTSSPNPPPFPPLVAEFAALHGRARLNAVHAYVRSRKTCPHCTMPRPSYSRVPLGIELEWPADTPWNSDAERAYCTGPFTAREALSILRNMPDADAALLGFDPAKSHPRNMVLTTLVVPPPCTRPAIYSSEGSRSRGQNDLTARLLEILKRSIDLR